MSIKDERTSNAMIAKALAARRWTAKPGRGHALAIFLPDACEPIAGSADVGLDLFDVRAALAGGTLLDSEVAETGMHMAVRAPRLAAYIKGLDDDVLRLDAGTGRGADGVPGHSGSGWSPG